VLVPTASGEVLAGALGAANIPALLLGHYCDDGFHTRTILRCRGAICVVGRPDPATPESRTRTV
jgi:hypothetical protein